MVAFNSLAVVSNDDVSRHPARIVLELVICSTVTGIAFFYWFTTPVLDKIGLKEWRFIGVIAAVAFGAVTMLATRSISRTATAAAIGLVCGAAYLDAWHDDVNRSLFYYVVEGLVDVWFEAGLFFLSAVIGGIAARYPLRRRALCAMLVAAAMFNAACDGYIDVEGRVYESAGQAAGDRSLVLVDNLASVLPAQLTPLPGAQILVEQWRPEDRTKRSRPDLWTERATTDERGYFKTGGIVAPGKYDATITVNREGYETAQYVFKHDRFRHHAIVVLVKKTRGP